MTQQEFLDKYGIKATFEDMDKATGYLKFKGDLLTTDTAKTSAQMKYTAGLDFMFTKFMDAQLTMRGREDIVIIAENIKLEDFLVDYENVMSERSDNDIREPYEGLEVDALTTLKNVAKSYNKNIMECLKDRVKKGASLWDLSKQTKFESNAGWDRYIESKKAACTMHSVMKDIISERTWKDRINPLNWWRMITENIYMIHLKNQVEAAIRYDTKTAAKSISEQEFNSFVNTNRYSERDIIYEDQIEEFDAYKQAREDELGVGGKNLSVDDSQRTSIIVDAANDALDRTIEIQDPLDNVPKKDLNSSRDSF